MEDVWELLSELASKDIKLSVEDAKLNCYAPKGSLTTELANGIARFKPAIIDILKNGDGIVSTVPSPGEFPLSVGEHSHYMLQTLNPQRSHAVPICITTVSYTHLRQPAAAEAGIAAADADLSRALLRQIAGPAVLRCPGKQYLSALS